MTTLCKCGSEKHFQRHRYEKERLLLTVKLGSLRSRKSLFKPETYWFTQLAETKTKASILKIERLLAEGVKTISSLITIGHVVH